MGRRLHPDEKALWGRVIETVRPLHPVPPRHGEGNRRKAGVEGHAPSRVSSAVQQSLPVPLRHAPHGPPPRSGEDRNNLDSHWDRRIHKGAIIPDISIDLHGQGLASAHARLDRALDQAIHQKLRVILLVTGKARAHDRAAGTGRGAIAAVVRDWLAASRFASSIAAVRQAHPRHGGDGALYIVLKR
jgi:DNA-nicking Smr family endonuclease